MKQDRQAAAADEWMSSREIENSQIFLICVVTFKGLPRFKVCITTGNKEIHIIERKPCWISIACPGGTAALKYFNAAVPGS
jgi:hypothetical protein